MEGSSTTLSRFQLDFEQFDLEISAIGGRTRLLGRELQPWQIDTLDLDGVQLQILEEGGANTYEGECEHDHVIFGLALPAPATINSQGSSLGPDRMVVFRPGESIASHSDGVSRYCILTVPVDFFDGTGEHFDPAGLEQLTGKRNVIDIAPQAHQRTVDLVRRVCRESRRDRGLDNAPSRLAAARELVGTFLETTASGTDDAGIGRPRIPRRKYIHKIREYMNMDQPGPRSVVGMARHVGVSGRTLRKMVREVFGTSPIKLIQVDMLHRIRADLLKAPRHRTVSHIAADHDVWELGRLAQRYRRIFNESPSETLAAGPKNA